DEQRRDEDGEAVDRGRAPGRGHGEVGPAPDQRSAEVGRSQRRDDADDEGQLEAEHVEERDERERPGEEGQDRGPDDGAARAHACRIVSWRRRLFRMQADGESGERREGGRAPIELKVEYKKLNTFFADYTRNISKGGTFIKTRKPLDEGTEFVFKLVVPKLPEPLAIRGAVKWVVRDDGKESG